MSQKELQRLQQWRLGVLRHYEEVTHNVAKTCRHYGISRTAFYRWRDRYEQLGLDGLRDRSRRPLRSPRATPAEVLAKIATSASTITSAPGRSRCISSGTTTSR